MKDKKTLVIILVVVLLLAGLASISAKTILSDYIMSLIKGAGGECGGRDCKCKKDCSGSKAECKGADDCGGKPCVVKFEGCYAIDIFPEPMQKCSNLGHGQGCAWCDYGSCKQDCSHSCNCGGAVWGLCDCSVGLCYCKS